MKIVLLVVIVLALVTGFAVLVAATGMVEVAADQPHGDLTAWYLELARERAIHGELDAIRVPELGEERVAAGAAAHRTMCAGCHGAPGREPGAVGQGLNPEPPDLAAEEWSGREHRAEAFWVTSHGIRMTGMPAFGVTHDDEAVWDLVAFLGRLPELDPEGYTALADSASPGGHGYGSGGEEVEGTGGGSSHGSHGHG